MNRIALTLAVAALALPAVGCGEASSTGAAGASVVPAGAKLFVSVDTSFDSGNWDAARTLLAKFPDGDRAVGRFMQQLGGQGIDFERDVRPALGPETDLVGLDLSGAGKMVGLTQPADPAKLSALLAKSDQPLVSREIDGWTAFSDSEANLDQFQSLQKDGTLDSVDTYEKLTDHVADDALAHVYVASSALNTAGLAGTLGTGATAFSLDPQEDGVHLQGAASTTSSDLFSDTFKAELPSVVPGGVYLYERERSRTPAQRASRHARAGVAWARPRSRARGGPDRRLTRRGRLPALLA